MERHGDKISKEEEEEKTRNPIVVILVGAPGSGKSTFCDNVIKSARRPWVRICQDTIGNGKAGTKLQCLNSAASALRGGKSVFIDRCNIDREQRAEFCKLGGPQVDFHAVVLDIPSQLCISRSVKRTGHEGNLQGGKAAAVVNRMLQKKELPKLDEGFSRITFCRTEDDVKVAMNTYSALGPLDNLPSGCFGQKSPDAKKQLGIMKFLKKVEVPNDRVTDTNSCMDSGSTNEIKKQEPCFREPEKMTSIMNNAVKEVKEDENLAEGFSGGTVPSCDVPTLAFPSISTSDFQFNHEKASDIIVEKVDEFLKMVGTVRLVLVDLTHGSKILSLVKAKAAKKMIDPNRFFTFVGDITQLYTGGGLCCNVIANAANWRLKPGGGGVNAAIFNAAGPLLEIATKERAGSLSPGKAVVIPLPSKSPLYKREGVTHVIHVLGPNMNPNRPNFLSNDYIKGCNILREAYSSLFEGFASIATIQSTVQKGNDQVCGSRPSELQDLSEKNFLNHFSSSDQNFKRKDGCESEKSKRCKESYEQHGSGATDLMGKKAYWKTKELDGGATKAWSSWAQALYHIAMHPKKHMNDVMEISDDVVVLNDLYPKAKRHLLVLARIGGLDCLADVGKEHLQLLRTMHAVGLTWAGNFLSDDASLIFRLGYHSAPSMRQLHLHVISQDFDSVHLKNKKHWNSFNSSFFRDSVDVIEEVDKYGKATLNDNDSQLSIELRCHRCRSAHPSIPRLKSHISNCRAPFPGTLLQNGRLIFAQNGAGRP